MAVWPFLMGAAGVLLVVSKWVGNRWAAHVSTIILAAYFAVQVKKFIFADNELAFVATSFIWAVAAGAIPRQFGSNLTQNMVRVGTIRLCLAASALCYFWARIVDAPRVFGSAPFMTADLLLIAAMLVTGGSLRVGIVGRIHDLGRAVSGYSDIRGRSASGGIMGTSKKIGDRHAG